MLLLFYFWGSVSATAMGLGDRNTWITDPLDTTKRVSAKGIFNKTEELIEFYEFSFVPRGVYDDPLYWESALKFLCNNISYFHSKERADKDKLANELIRNVISLFANTEAYKGASKVELSNIFKIIAAEKKELNGSKRRRIN